MSAPLRSTADRLLAAADRFDAEGRAAMAELARREACDPAPAVGKTWPTPAPRPRRPDAR